MGGSWGTARALLAVAAVVSIATGCSGNGSGNDGQAGTAAAKDATVRIEEDLPPELADQSEVGLDVYGSGGEAVALQSVANGRIGVRWSDDDGRTWTSADLPGDDYRGATSTWLRQAGDTFVVLAKTGGEVEPSDDVELGDELTPDTAVVSTDGGRTWKRTELPDIGADLWNPYSLAAAATDDHLAIVGELSSPSGQVLGWISDDEGGSWERFSTTEGNEPQGELSRVSTHDGAIRLWTDGRSDVDILATEDGGKTWTRETAPDAASDDLFDHVDIDGAWWSSPAPDLDDDQAGQTAPRLRRSLDDGATWETISVGSTTCAAGIDEPRHRVSVPLRAGGLLVAVTACTDDGGRGLPARRDVWASGDGGDHWSRLRVEGRSVDPRYTEAPGYATFGEAWLAPEDTSDPFTVVDPFHRTASQRTDDRKGVESSANVRPPEPGEVLEPTDGIWYRFWVTGSTDGGGYGGYGDYGEEPTHDHLDLTVYEDGQVVSAGSGDVAETTEAYTSFQLTPEALDELIGWIQGTDLLGMPNDDGHAGWDGSAFSYGDGYVVEPVPDEIAARLADLSWLGDGVSDPEPWVPDQIGVDISQYDPAEDGPTQHEPVQAWPLDRPVELTGREDGDPLQPGEPDADGDITYGSVCVSGDDAASLFSLMRRGIGRIRVRVDDGSGEPWQVALDPIVPGSIVMGSPCE